MNDENTESIIIKVGIYDTLSSTTVLKITPTTTASEICIAIANKIDLSPDQAKYHNLILVYTGFSDKGSRKFYCVRTIRSKECVLRTLNAVIAKQNKKHSLDRDYESSLSAVRWFYKDARSLPLEFGDSGDVSGNSSSDDEVDLSYDDLSYLRQVERRGFMLKRSSKDPNVWKKRYCVLVDKLWIVNVQGKQPKATYIKLTGQISVEEKIETYNYPFCLAIQSPLRTLSASPLEVNTTYIRASSPSEQTSWKNDILKRPPLNSANEIMDMAEIIICDYEFQQSVKLHQDISCSLEHIINSWTQNTYNIEANIERNPTTIVFDSNMVEIDCQVHVPLTVQNNTTGAASIYQSYSVPDTPTSSSKVQCDGFGGTNVDPMTGGLGLIRTRSYSSYINHSSNPNIVYTPSSNLHNNSNQLSTVIDYPLNTSQSTSSSMKSLIYGTQQPAYCTTPTDNAIDDTYNINVTEGYFDDALSDDRSSDGSNHSLIHHQECIQQALYFRVHRLPTCSYVHRFYSGNPTLTNMMSFLIEANKYKILFRYNLSSSLNSRQLWIAALRIYLKFILVQIDHAKKSSKIMKREAVEVNQDYSKHDSQGPGPPSLVSGPPRLSLRLPNSNSSFEDLMVTQTQTEDETERQAIVENSNNNNNNSTVSIIRRSDFENSVEFVNWNVSLSNLIEVHKKIFSNVYRQIVGLRDTGSSGTDSESIILDDEGNTFSLFSKRKVTTPRGSAYSTSTSTGSEQEPANAAGASSYLNSSSNININVNSNVNSNSQSNSQSTSSGPSGVSSVSSFPGSSTSGMPSTVSSLSSASASSSSSSSSVYSLQNATNANLNAFTQWFGWKAPVSETIEVIGPSEHSPDPNISLQEIMSTGTGNGNRFLDKSSKRQDASLNVKVVADPMYQIMDMNIKPSPNLFDELISEVEIIILTKKAV